MDIPNWFGITEFYAILGTVWFFLIVWLIVNIIKVKKEIKVKEWTTKIKSWWSERKKKKEEKHCYLE